MQDCSNSIANALELLQSCAKPLICGPNITVTTDTQLVPGDQQAVLPRKCFLRCFLTAHWWLTMHFHCSWAINENNHDDGWHLAGLYEFKKKYKTEFINHSEFDRCPYDSIFNPSAKHQSQLDTKHRINGNEISWYLRVNFLIGHQTRVPGQYVPTTPSLQPEDHRPRRQIDGTTSNWLSRTQDRISPWSIPLAIFQSWF